MKTSLVGQIFHFKPREKEEGEEAPDIPPKPPDTPWGKKRKGGRRSNRLFALHPVVVIKDLRPGVIENPNFKETLARIPIHVKEKVKPLRNEYCPHDTPAETEDDGVDKSEWHDTSWLEAAPFFDDEVPEPYATPTPSSPSSETSTQSSTPATTPASSLSELALDGVSPSKPRRLSLERRDAEINVNEKVVIVNITSQVHDYVDERNYLPIAAPGREYLADFEKRVFLAPVDSPEPSPVTSPEEQDNNWDTDSQWSPGTIDTQYSHWEDPQWEEWEDDVAKESPPQDPGEDRYLSNIPEIEPLQPPPSDSPRPDSPGFTEWSSDDIWLEQIPYIDDLMPQSVCLPRHDSYVRLDSRTTIPVGELEPFRRPAGGSYEIHPYSLDLLWQSVIECERGWRRPEESVLWDIECTAERQVEDIINEQATSSLAALQRQALAGTRQVPAARVLQDFSRGAFNLFQELRVKKKVLLKEIYTQLHTEPVLRPTQQKPFHEGSKLGEMLRAALRQKEMGIGEGEASLNTPIMSKLALKAKKLGEPPPSKKEEARARKDAVATRPHRSSSNPEAARPRIPHHPPFEHSKSATAIATQIQKPKATFHNEPPAKPRIQDKNWAEAPNWRGSPKPSDPDTSRSTDRRSTFNGKLIDVTRFDNTKRPEPAPRVVQKPIAQPEQIKKTHANAVEQPTSASNIVNNANPRTKSIKPVRTERGELPATTMRRLDSLISHSTPAQSTPTNTAKQTATAPKIVGMPLAHQTQSYNGHPVGLKPQAAAPHGSSLRPAPSARVAPSRGPQEKMSVANSADRLPTKEEFLLILARMPKNQQPSTVLGAKEGQQQGLNFNAQPGEVVQRRKSGVVVRGDDNPIIFAFVHKDQYINHPRRASFPRNNIGY